MKRGFIQATLLILAGALVLGAGYVAKQEINRIEGEVEKAKLSAFNPAAGDTYRLRSSIGTTDTSISLSEFKTPISSIPITMSVLDSDIGYGTIDPQSSTRKEFISFTGVTQNADGTATLTGVTRGLSFVSPFTASSTLRKSHPGQSIFILSDSPQLFEEYAPRRDSALITGDWNITGSWGFDTAATTTTCTSDLEICNKTYIDNSVNQGAATSTETNGGIVELATAIEVASSTDAGVNKPLVLQAKNASSSPDLTNTGPLVVVTNTARKIAQAFLDLTQAFTWTGAHVFNSTVDIEADAAANLTLNTVGYEFPSAQGGADEILTNDGSGVLSWGLNRPVRYTFATTTQITATAGTFATSTGITIPAGTLTASSTIDVRANGSACTQTNSGTSASCTFYLRNASGQQVFSAVIGTTDNTNTNSGWILNGLVVFDDGLSSSQTVGNSFFVTTGTPSTGSQGFTGSSVINFANEQTLYGVIGADNVGNATARLNGLTIIVNP